MMQFLNWKSACRDSAATCGFDHRLPPAIRDTVIFIYRSLSVFNPVFIVFFRHFSHLIRAGPFRPFRGARKSHHRLLESSQSSQSHRARECARWREWAEKERERDGQTEECPASERYHDATAAYITEREGRGGGRQIRRRESVWNGESGRPVD